MKVEFIRKFKIDKVEIILAVVIVGLAFGAFAETQPPASAGIDITGLPIMSETGLYCSGVVNAADGMLVSMQINCAPTHPNAMFRIEPLIKRSSVSTICHDANSSWYPRILKEYIGYTTMDVCLSADPSYRAYDGYGE